MDPLKVILVGPSGVGKTSLLTAMYDQLTAEIEKLPGCSFDTADAVTASMLDERRQELERHASAEGMKVEVGGISPTAQERDFVFRIAAGGAGEQGELRFIDLPGGWYMGKGDHQRADELLREAHVSLLVLDATALMASPEEGQTIGRYNNAVNAPRVIFEAYKRTLKDADNGHAVVIALVRAESYLQEGRAEDLYEAAIASNRKLIDFLKKRNIPVLACAVQTMGSLRLLRVQEKAGAAVFQFYRVQGRRYSPVDCDVPLRFTLKLILDELRNEAEARKIEADGFLNRVLNFFDIENDLKKATLSCVRLEQLFATISSRLGKGKIRQF
jgi:hypothetical protein